MIGLPLEGAKMLFVDNISVVVRSTLVQVLTPDEMLGRVSAVNNVFISSSNQLGGFESGLVARLIGPTLSVVTGGIGTLLVVWGVDRSWPEVRHFTQDQVAGGLDAAGQTEPVPPGGPAA